MSSGTRMILGTGTTGMSGVTWTMYSDGELDISATSAKNYIGRINNWDSDWDELVTTVKIKNIKAPGSSSNGDPSTVFSNFVNCKTLKTSKEFGRGAATNYGLKLRYTDWFYDGSLTEWCTSRDNYHSNAPLTPQAGNQFNLYLNDILLSGDVIVPLIGTSGEFSYVKNITSATFSSGITKISNYMFYHSTAIAITLNEGITTVGDHSFRASDLESINIPSTLKTIGVRMFQNCARLTQVVFPSNITSVGSYAFNGCSALTLLDFSHNTSVPTLGSNALTSTPSSLIIRVPSSLYDSWKTASGWSAYASKIVAV